ncbi:hypothetical protein DEO72_LG7g752 [Vigna unguiculata]|uniref:Uncharacterized protein n=1 Tax=Vigna unguiculata TaxID=3917 RepID=A0A4D6MFE1_VIGUN|nr:hypothetical protein DEO72_LG7g752 [Vigna unguiculata]
MLVLSSIKRSFLSTLLGFLSQHEGFVLGGQSNVFSSKSKTQAVWFSVVQIYGDGGAYSQLLLWLLRWKSPASLNESGSVMVQASRGDNNVKVLMVDTGKGSHFRVRVSFLLLLATRSFFCFILVNLFVTSKQRDFSDLVVSASTADGIKGDDGGSRKVD